MRQVRSGQGALFPSRFGDSGNLIGFRHNGVRPSSRGRERVDTSSLIKVGVNENLGRYICAILVRVLNASNESPELAANQKYINL